MAFPKLLLIKEVTDAVNCRCQIICYLFAGFKTIILCSVHSIQFVKCIFSAKIWLVKISTKIVKYEYRVAISDSVHNTYKGKNVLNS